MTEKRSSRLPGFYNLSPEERRKLLSEVSGLSPQMLRPLGDDRTFNIEKADHMIENVVGVFNLPLGIATNFIINGREILVPMAIEEPSVVAGASYMAKLIRAGGGFIAKATGSEMIGQIQILDVPDLEDGRACLMENKAQILEEADQVDPILKQLGGGAKDLEVRIFEDTPAGPMLVVHLIIDTRDAMGANAVNTAAETITPMLESLSGGRAHLRILSNLADRRLTSATCSIPQDVFKFKTFSGEHVRDGIVEAWAFAAVDPYRATTHNKGIMNGVDAVLIATGNDWRAVEAGAHAYAARSGHYTSLSEWRVAENGNLEGKIEMPLAVGIVGGATRVHPTAKAALALMEIQSAQELAEVIVSVGLAQNLAALRALATEGIQRGHMSLHARQVALAAGAEGSTIDTIAQRMIDKGEIRVDYAQKLIAELNEDRSRE